MSGFLRPFRLLAALVLLLLGADASALYPLKRGYTKFFMQGTNPTVVAEASKGLDVTLLWYYPTHPNIGAGSLVSIRDGDVSPFVQRVWEIRGDVSARSIDEILHFSVTLSPFRVEPVDVDPTVGIPPIVPASQLFASYPAGAAGLYFVQFIGPMADEWLREIEATGMIAAKLPVYEMVSSLWLNRALFIGTPEQAARAKESTRVQWIEIFHPFMRGPDPGALHARQTYRFYIEVPAAFRASVLDELAMIGTVRDDGSVMTIDILGENWPRLQQYRLLMRLQRAHVPVWISAAWPHRAAPGSIVRLTGNIPESATIRFRGVAARRVERIGDIGVRVEVPGIVDGPADLTVHAADGTSAALVSDSREGFTAGAPNSAGSLVKGDLVFLDGYIDNFLGGPAYLRVFGADGTRHAQTEPIGRGLTRGFAIDRDGFVVTAEGARVDASLRNRGRAESFLYAHDLIADAHGDFYASGTGDGWLAKLTAGGAVIQRYPIAPHAFDLASDQCTLVYATVTSYSNAHYTQSISIRRYDVCRSVQLADVVSGITTQYGTPIRDLDIGPDGSVFTVVGNELHQYTSAGTLVAVRRMGDGGFRFFAFSPDPAIAYASSYGSIHRYEVASGAVTTVAAAQYPGAYDLAVYGGWTAARGLATYAEGPSIASVDAGAGVVRGSNFRPGTIVLVNGIAAQVQFIDAATLRVVFPNGVRPSSVVVTNPNGQSATFIIAFDMHDVPALDAFALWFLCAAVAAVGLMRMR